MINRYGKTYYVVVVNIEWNKADGEIFSFLKTKDARFSVTAEEFEQGWRVMHKEAFKADWAKNEYYMDIDAVSK